MLGRMNVGRMFKALAAGLAVSSALAACGGGGGGSVTAPSALDPANMVPATALAYANIAIRPQGSIRTDLVEAIDSIAGPGAARKLSTDWARSAHGWRAIKPYLGQHMGIALTALPTSQTAMSSLEQNILVVFPSDDPAAARRAERRTGHTSGEVSRVVGHYLLVGGATAVAQAAATSSRTSLASDPGFTADSAQLGNGQLLSAYVPLHRLYEQVLPLLETLPQYSGANRGALRAGARQAPPGSSIALGMSARPKQFRLDVVEHGMPQSVNPATGVATDVGALPASSWLAVTLGGTLTRTGTVSKLASSLSSSLSKIQAAQGIAGGVPSGPLQFLTRDLLPALGPAELSVSGSSSTTLQAGLVMDPVDRRAGVRLAKALRHLVSGLPVLASTSGGRVAVTFGFSNLQQLLNPSAKLAASPAFKQALAQLPSGGKADLYLSFSSIAALAALDPSAGSPSTIRVLHRLDYLIAGGTHSHFRLVLATN
jgi:hypothetical protein